MKNMENPIFLELVRIASKKKDTILLRILITGIIRDRIKKTLSIKLLFKKISYLY